MKSDVCFDALVWKEERVYVSYCPQFGVSSCGDTVEEARRMLREAVCLFIEGAKELGTLQKILDEAVPGSVGKNLSNYVEGNFSGKY